MGVLLAREAPAHADIVVPVPDSGNAAALGYSASPDCLIARLSSAIIMWAALSLSLRRQFGTSALS